MICSNPQTTAGCKCRKTVELNLVSPWPARRLRPVQFGPCDQCAEFQDLQRAHEIREQTLIAALTNLANCADEFECDTATADRKKSEWQPVLLNAIQIARELTGAR